MRDLVANGHDTGPVNIGTEDTVSLHELVEMICDIAGRMPRLKFDRSEPEGRFIKSSDAKTLRAVLPEFRPSIALNEGLQLMSGWYERNFTGTQGRVAS